MSKTLPNNPQTDVKNLQPIQKFAMSIGAIPESYLLSLTFQELALWLCDYLKNTVIPTINNNSDAVSELQQLYIQLKNYVDNYFNNLDVQDEINNKLDDLVDDGTLTNLIKNYVNPFIDEQNSNIENFKETINLNINSINNKVNSVASGSPTPVSSTSDMTDTSKTYLNTSDGNWYYYNGSSWTIGGVYQATQISDNSIFPSMLSDILKNSQNLLTPSFSKNNGFYSSTGVFNNNENFRYSSPIKLLKNQTIFARIRAYDNISVFCSCDENGSNISPLIRGKGNFLTDYQYKADKDTYIIVSGANDTFLVFINNYLNLSDFSEFSLNPLNLSTPEFSLNSGYIDNHGEIQNNSSYYYSSPILLLKDDEIFINCDVDDNISVISTSLLNNTNDLTPSVLSNSSNSFYNYKATDSCYVILSFKNTSNPSIIIKNNNNNLPFSNYTTSPGYLDINGNLTNNPTFKHTSPIKILKNQTIKCTLRGYNTISVFAKCDESGNNISPLLPGIDNKLRDYQYTSNEDTYIIVSGVNENPFLIYIDNISNDIITINKQISEIINNLNDFKPVPLLSIFEKIGMIGDSHASGAIEGGSSSDNHNLSYLQHICNQCGNTPLFYSRSGESTKSWLDYNYSVQPCDAYFIALGSNDRVADYPVGSSSDINTDNSSFYAYYYKIIQKLKTVNPNAKIFLFTLYGSPSDSNSVPYNNAIEYFAENTENCFLVDMRNSYITYEQYKIRWSHVRNWLHFYC